MMSRLARLVFACIGAGALSGCVASTYTLYPAEGGSKIPLTTARLICLNYDDSGQLTGRTIGQVLPLTVGGDANSNQYFMVADASLSGPGVFQPVKGKAGLYVVVNAGKYAQNLLLAEVGEKSLKTFNLVGASAKRLATAHKVMIDGYSQMTGTEADQRAFFADLIAHVDALPIATDCAAS